MKVMELDAMILGFWMLSFKGPFSLSSFTLIKRLFSSSSFSAIRVVSPAYLKVNMKVKLHSRVQLFVTPWTVANQAPPSMGFSRQEYWSGLPFPSPRLLIFLPTILIPAFESSSLAFCIMYSAYKLDKQGDNIQPWHTPFPILTR